MVCWSLVRLKVWTSWSESEVMCATECAADAAACVPPASLSKWRDLRAVAACAQDCKHLRPLCTSAIACDGCGMLSSCACIAAATDACSGWLDRACMAHGMYRNCLSQDSSAIWNLLSLFRASLKSLLAQTSKAAGYCVVARPHVCSASHATSLMDNQWPSTTSASARLCNLGAVPT